ncbi:DNA gyrase inhibitor YacG [Litorivivens sp.]
MPTKLKTAKASSTAAQKTLRVKCPGCQADVVWSQQNPSRPFCSESCKNGDFIAWANGERVVAGDDLMSDVFSGDLENFE